MKVFLGTWLGLASLMTLLLLLVPHAAETVIVIAWLLLPVLALLFLLLFGLPTKYKDRTMAWHLAITTTIAGLEPVGFLLSGLSLIPAALIYIGSVGVLGWRTVLLIRTRRNRAYNDARDTSSPEG